MNVILKNVFAEKKIHWLASKKWLMKICMSHIYFLFKLQCSILELQTCFFLSATLLLEGRTLIFFSKKNRLVKAGQMIIIILQILQILSRFDHIAMSVSKPTCFVSPLKTFPCTQLIHQSLKAHHQLIQVGMYISVPKVIFLQAAEFSAKTNELLKWP